MSSTEANILNRQSPTIVTKSGDLLDISLKGKIGEGAEAEIFGASVRLKKGKRDRLLGFVYRSRRSERIGNAFELEYYNEAKKAGLPVPATFRSTEDGRDLLISDLSENGRNLVLSETDLFYERRTLSGIYSEHLDLISNFIKYTPINSEQQKEKCKEFSKLGAKANLVIPTDAWFIVIKPDGAYSFMIGDFGGVSKAEGSKWQGYAEEYNNENLDRVIYAISTLQDYGKDPVGSNKRLKEYIDKNSPWLKVKY